MENILEKINSAGLKLLETMTTEETYVVIVKEAVQLVDAEFGSIFLHRNEDLEHVYTSLPELSQYKIAKKGYVLKTFKTRKPYVINIDEIEHAYPHMQKIDIKSMIFIPLSYHNESLGVLCLHSRRNEHFSGKQLEVLTLFGAMGSLAIKKAQQYSETKKALEIRDMFISMAAHELRTPLTSLNGYIQLLYSKLANREGVEGKWMQELYSESKRLTNLVKELLEVNRIRTGQIQFMWQECNLSEVLNKSVKEMIAIYPDREIIYENKLKTEDDGIIGDGSKLLQVFNNIIDNAIKYSPKNTGVHIEIASTSGNLVVKVKDQGKGIDKKDLPHIFEGRHQGEGGEEGMGIGLFFVESVIRQHKGAINVKSKLKKGTTFEIRIPRSKL